MEAPLRLKIFSGKLSFPLPIADSLIILNVKCLVGWSGTSFSFSRPGVEDTFSWGNTYFWSSISMTETQNSIQMWIECSCEQPLSPADESTSVWATACSFFDSREGCRGAACQQYQQSGIVGKSLDFYSRFKVILERCLWWLVQYIEENERLRAILSEWSMRAANVIWFWETSFSDLL